MAIAFSLLVFLSFQVFPSISRFATIWISLLCWTDRCFNLFLPKPQRMDHESFRSPSTVFAVVVCHLQYLYIAIAAAWNSLAQANIVLHRLWTSASSAWVSNHLKNESGTPRFLLCIRKHPPESIQKPRRLKLTSGMFGLIKWRQQHLQHQNISPASISTHEYGRCLTLFDTCSVLMGMGERCAEASRDPLQCWIAQGNNSGWRREKCMQCTAKSMGTIGKVVRTSESQHSQHCFPYALLCAAKTLRNIAQRILSCYCS